jgi:hypothetical protein
MSRSRALLSSASRVERPTHSLPAPATVELLIALVCRAQRANGGAVRASQVLEIANIDERAQLPLHRFGARSFGLLLTRSIGIPVAGLHISSCGKPNGSGSYKVVQSS